MRYNIKTKAVAILNFKYSRSWQYFIDSNIRGKKNTDKNLIAENNILVDFHEIYFARIHRNFSFVNVHQGVCRIYVCIGSHQRMQPRSRLIPGESLDNRRRVIAFALEPTIYDQSRQCQVYAFTFTGWLMRPDLHCGNNIQRLVFSTDARSFRFTWHLTSRLIDQYLLILFRFLHDLKFLQKNCRTICKYNWLVLLIG